MKIVWILLAMVACASAAEHDHFIAMAAETHGSEGAKAARFLVEHMPPKDRESLSSGFLMRNLDLALQARNEFPWAKAVPEDVFLNDVLPYAVLDESRDSWREDFLEKARPIVKDAKSAGEAAQALNRAFFKLINVHYHTGRRAPNQSPKESMASGRATCTGLSIILVNACRAVGVPARAVGTPMWSNGRGNHTWVEVWDGDWHFTGADEYNPKGLDRGWFLKDAAHAKTEVPEHAIYASSWRRNGLSFPLVWAPKNHAVAAVNVTARYAKPAADGGGKARLGVRLLDSGAGQRMVAKVRACDASGHTFIAVETRAGTEDLNDMPRIPSHSGTKGWLFFSVGNETRELQFGPLEPGDPTVDAVWPELAPCSPAIAALLTWLAVPPADRDADAPALRNGLSKEDAEKTLFLLGGERLATLAGERRAEFDSKALVHGDKTMRWLEKTFGEEPPGGHSLWISMHGGGGAPAAVNDSQWKNQIRLYQPKEGIYVAPRAPTNTWNLWHKAHIDPMFQRLIETYVALRGVNPDKVYLMGYSAGGDGVWQLAPRMADRFAAAAMMAGHPNDSSLLGLRNLPFAVFVGGRDAAYGRNEIVARKAAELDVLAAADAGSYVHIARIYPDVGHWMNGKDAEALPWMAKFHRNPWPRKIVWLQDNVTHDRFYWLKLPARTAKVGQKITATVDGQAIRMEGDVPDGMTLVLSDALLDLDRYVTVSVNGKAVFSGTVKRTPQAILQCLLERADFSAAGTAMLVLP